MLLVFAMWMNEARFVYRRKRSNISSALPLVRQAVTHPGDKILNRYFAGGFPAAASFTLRAAFRAAASAGLT